MPPSPPAQPAGLRTAKVEDLKGGETLSSILLPSVGISRPIVFTVPVSADRHGGEVGFRDGTVRDSFGRMLAR